MTSFQTIASGSSGNAALLCCGEVRLLIDLGVSCRRLCQARGGLGLSPGELTAALVSHEHTDHTGGLATYIKKYGTPIFCAPGTARALSRRIPGIEGLLRPVPMWESVAFGPVRATLLASSHDCGEGTAFRFDTPDGAVGVLTDTGYVIEGTGRRLAGAELLVLESNHDAEMVRSGPYPYGLKQRVLGAQGHLSNEDAARFAAASARAGTRTILLAHLSRENNRPELALETVGRALEEIGWRGRLAVAPSDVMSEAVILEGAAWRE